MYKISIKMGYKQYKIKCQTDDLVLKCVEEFLRHHPEMKEIKISKNKIVYEMARFYLEVK